jgi:hypothetical protein
MRFLKRLHNWGLFYLFGRVATLQQYKIFTMLARLSDELVSFKYFLEKLGAISVTLSIVLWFVQILNETKLC